MTKYASQPRGEAGLRIVADQGNSAGHVHYQSDGAAGLPHPRPREPIVSDKYGKKREQEQIEGDKDDEVEP